MEYKEIQAHDEVGKILANHNEWLHLIRTKRKGLTKTETKLRGSLDGWNLEGYKFIKDDFSYMNLQNTKFNGSQFMNCNLTGVNACNADFNNAFFYHTNLEHSCFYYADFTKASINQSIIDHSFFIKSKFKETTFNELETMGAFLVKVEGCNVLITNTTFDISHIDHTFITVQ